MPLVGNQEFIIETIKKAGHSWMSPLSTFLSNRLYPIYDLENLFHRCRAIANPNRDPGCEQFLPEILHKFHQHRDDFFRFAVAHPDHYVFIKTILNEAAAEFNPDNNLLSRITELETIVAQLREQLYYLPGNSPAYSQAQSHWKGALQ